MRPKGEGDTPRVETLVEQLIRHEGLRLKPYRCSTGHLTIGVGRNLDAKGISDDEAMYLMESDIQDCITFLDENLPWARGLPVDKFNVLVNMCFNLGGRGLLGFRRFLTNLECRNFRAAKVEMLDSKWARQVGKRAIELANIIEEGGDNG